jgi:hypothetical protein
MVKQLLIAAMLCLTLTGCPKDGEVKETIIVRDVYVLVTLPEDITTMPKNVAPLNLDTATQKDIAIWLTDNEKRIANLETIILTYKNVNATVKEKKNLKEGDYVILEFTKEDLQGKVK